MQANESQPTPHRSHFGLPPEPATPGQKAALAAVLALGAALRIFRLGHWSLWYDEGASLYFSRFATSVGALFDDSNTSDPPAIAVLVRLWTGLVGTLGLPATSAASDFAIRLLPCMFGILAMPVLYALAVRVAGCRRAAIATVFLYAIAPFHIFYAQELRIYSFLTLVALAACWFMVRALDEDRPALWFGLVASLAVMMYSHYISMWYIFACGVFYLTVLPQYKRHFWKWTAWFAGLMVAIVPSLYMAVKMNAHVLSIKYHWYDNPTVKTGFITLKNFFAGYSPAAWAYWPLFVVALGLLLAGIAVLARRRYPAAALVAVFVFVPLWGNVALWAYRDFSFYEHRIFIVSAAAALVGAGAAVAALPHRALRIGALGLVALLTLPGLADYYRQRLHPIDEHRLGINYKADFRSAARFLNERVGEDEAVAYASHFMVYSLHHYLDVPHRFVSGAPNPIRLTIDMLGSPALLYKQGLLPDRIAKAAGELSAIWFMETHGITFEYKPHTELVVDWLEAQWVRGERFTFDGITVTLYTRPEQWTAPAREDTETETT